MSSPWRAVLLAGHTFSGSPRRPSSVVLRLSFVVGWGSVVASAAAAASNLACHRVAAFCPGRLWHREHRAEQSRLSLNGEASTKMCDRLLTNEPPNRGKNDKFAVATAQAAVNGPAVAAAGNDL